MQNLNRNLRLLILTSILTLTSACTSFLNKPDSTIQNTSWEQHRYQLLGMNNWQVRGKFSIDYQKENIAGNLYWKQKENAYHIQLSGPVGMGRLILKSDGHQIEVKSKEGVLYFHSAEQALNHFQLPPLPVQQIKYWIKGIPDANIEFNQLNLNQGSAASFTQSSHSINYENYSQVSSQIKSPVASYILPTRMNIAYPNYNVLLVLKAWTINP